MSEIERLKQTNKELLEACESVVNSCVHPEVAVRAVMVKLDKIRAAIARAKMVDKSP